MEFYPLYSRNNVEDQRPREFAKEHGVKRKPIVAIVEGLHTIVGATSMR
jgi:hypothetical protein